MVAAFSILLLLLAVVHQNSGIEISKRQTISPMDPRNDGVVKSLEICWGFNESHIEVKLAYPTLGWLAMGLSPDGGMDQSDVLFAYVDDVTNEVVVQDRFITVDRVAMKLNFSVDEHQNWQMISGSKNGTHTMIRAVRKIDTGDAPDRAFQSLPMKVIYSYNFKTPTSRTGMPEKHNVRGSTVITFLVTDKTPMAETPMAAIKSMADSGQMMTNDMSSVMKDLPYNIMLSPSDNRDSIPKWLEIRWNFNDTHVDVMLCYPSLGWIAMGLSPNGGMDHSDILFAYIDDVTQKVVVQDRFLTVNKEAMMVSLSLNEQQDWRMVSGKKNGTHTMVRAVRSIKTCDPFDLAFTNQSRPVIYSYNFETPKSDQIQMHDVRGATSINFLNPQEQESMMKSLTDVMMNISITMPNVHIDGIKDTEYICTLTQIPKLTSKLQVIAKAPIISKVNKKHIHHMLVYICDEIEEKFLKESTFPCGPNDNSFVMAHCRNLIGAWASGAPALGFEPPDVGLPFTPEMSGKKIVLQMHYDNSDHSTFTDDSGMLFMLTDKLRKFDQGNIMAGILDLDIMFTVPPGQESFQLQGHCSDQCTRSFIPPEGINIYGVAIHMHTRGQQGIARHFRGDQEILPPLGEDMYYDFNYQNQRPLITPRKFLPGDRIVVQCNYTTKHDTLPVFGGEGTMQEMCLAFLAYYPKAPLNICGSKYRINDYEKALGISPMRFEGQKKLTGAGEIGGMVTVNSKMAMEQQKIFHNFVQTITEPVRSFIQSKKWTAETIKPLEDLYSSNKYEGICITPNGTSMVMADALPFIPPVSLPNDNC